jgi:hypothetical protein
VPSWHTDYGVESKLVGGQIEPQEDCKVSHRWFRVETENVVQNALMFEGGAGSAASGR